MHAPVFKALSPAKIAKYAADSIFYKENIVENSFALVGCMCGERKALEILIALKEKHCRPVLYSERKPSPVFLYLARQMDEVSLLLCPESMEDVARCGKSTESGVRYISKAGQDKREIDALGQFIRLDSLSQMNSLLVFSIFEGLSLKETSTLTGKSEKYVKTGLARIKEKFRILDRRELLVALAKWISLNANDSRIEESCQIG